MSARTVLNGLLSVVAAAAAVLSFAALRDLAALCGFAPWLAWLLPVVVDAGAAAGSLVWLGGEVGRAARRFARTLALALLGLSVAANALGHGLAAFGMAPAWWVVVVVSAIAPAVLGAVVHLAVLVGRPTEHATNVEQTRDITAGEPGAARPDRVAELIAAGAGRRRLSRELEISEHEARQLLAQARSSTDVGGADSNGAASVDTTPSTASARAGDAFPDRVGGTDENEPDRRAAHGPGDDAAGRVAVLHNSNGHGGAR